HGFTRVAWVRAARGRFWLRPRRRLRPESRNGWERRPAAGRGIDGAQLFARRADLLHLKDFANGWCEAIALGDVRLAGLEKRGETMGFGGRQAQNRAFVQQCAVYLALRSVKAHPNAPLDFR